MEKELSALGLQCSNRKDAVSRKKTDLILEGGHRLRGIRVYEEVWAGPRPLTYINLHPMEVTSLNAAREVARCYGGTIIYVRASKDDSEKPGRREIKYRFGYGEYIFDANKVFGTNDDPVEEALRFKLVALIEKGIETNGRLIVSLHNNREHGRTTIDRYGREGGDRRNVSINKRWDNHSFYYVVGRKIFRALYKRFVNVYMQQARDLKRDAASLSAWAERNDIPFITVETRHGKLESQIGMIKRIIIISSEIMPADEQGEKKTLP